MRRTSATSVGNYGGSVGSNSSCCRSNGDEIFSRLKKFRICIWMTIGFTFLRLGTKPMISPPGQLEVKNKTRIPSSTPVSVKETEIDDMRLKKTPFPMPISTIHDSSLSHLPSPSPLSTSFSRPQKDHNEPHGIITTVSPHTVIPPTTQFNVSSSLSTATSTSPPTPNTSIVDVPTIYHQTLPLQSTPIVNTSLSTSRKSTYRNFNSLSAKTKAFVRRYCDLKNLKEGSWYPFGEDEWQLRAPYLIVAGTWDSGVNHLAQALLKHPQIDSARIHGFFLPRSFKKFISVSAKATPNSSSNGNSSIIPTLEATTEISNVQVFAARDRMYHVNYSPLSLQDTNVTSPTTTSSDDNDFGNSRSKHVAVDISPGLLFHARTTSYSIQCVSPWTKIVVLLRNPIDRLYQQWVYSKLKLSLMLTLEDWVAREMKAMQSVGLISGQKDSVKVPSPDDMAEKNAWKKYQAVSRNGAPLGRSMYVMQLDEWIQAYLDAGKNPKEEMIIISSERLEDHKVAQYSKLIDFLGLTPIDVPNDDDSILSTIVKPTIVEGVKPMSKETRSMLQQFFQPYNKRLTILLREHGFAGDWEKIWS
jgi:hypothetical protein